MSWYRVTRHDGRTSLWIGDNVGCWDRGTGELAEELGDDPVAEIVVDSSGGCARTGLEVHELLRGRVRTARIYRAHSAASVIALAAPQRAVVERGTFLIHPPRAAIYGGEIALALAVDACAIVDEDMAAVLCRETGQSLEVVRGWQKGETYFTDAESVAAGLAHQVVPRPRVVADLEAAQRGASEPGGCGDDGPLLVEILRAAGKFRVRDKNAMGRELHAWFMRNVEEIPRQS